MRQQGESGGRGGGNNGDEVEKCEKSGEIRVDKDGSREG